MMATENDVLDVVATAEILKTLMRAISAYKSALASRTDTVEPYNRVDSAVSAIQNNFLLPRLDDLSAHFLGTSKGRWTIDFLREVRKAIAEPDATILAIFKRDEELKALFAIVDRPGVSSDEAPIEKQRQKPAARKRRNIKPKPLTNRQREISEVLIRHNGDAQKAANELHISRARVEVVRKIFERKIAAADNVGGGAKPDSVGSDVLDMGGRQDGRTQRQRGRRDDSDDE